MPVITGAAEYPENVLEELKAKAADVEDFDALTPAIEAGSSKAVNIVLMGRLSKLMPMSKEKWIEAIKQTVAPKKGVVQVKVRATGKAKHTLCFITAQAEKVLPILSKQVAKAYTIYTLVWNEKEVINYVNDQEVSRGKNALTGEALHLLVRSYLPENQKAGTAQLDIDWIRIYTNA